jgi:hypothetical protein
MSLLTTLIITNASTKSKEILGESLSLLVEWQKLRIFLRSILTFLVARHYLFFGVGRRNWKRVIPEKLIKVLNLKSLFNLTVN